jgi:uncharacterized protein (TIGR02421 family)
VTEAKTSLRRVSDELVALQRPLRVLRSIRWDPQVRLRFLESKGRRLPQVDYPHLDFDSSSLCSALTRLRRRLVGRNPVEELLRRKCDELALVAQMLSARGSRAFFDCSARLYGYRGDGAPVAAALWRGPRDARRPVPLLDSQQTVALIRATIEPQLGRVCRVRESRRLTANAAAGARTIAVRKGARFTPSQARALAHHEGLWHVLTGLNGRLQPVLTILGVGLPGHTESQEGGGIVSEVLAGCVGEERWRELAARALAIDLAVRGADFIEVFRFLRERFDPCRAAQVAERAFRGGVLTGGAPFAKDAVYLRGARETFRFLQAAAAEPGARLVRAFVSGKMRIEDAPLVAGLIREGLCAEPVYLPDWAREGGLSLPRLPEITPPPPMAPESGAKHRLAAARRREPGCRAARRKAPAATCRRSGSS